MPHLMAEVDRALPRYGISTYTIVQYAPGTLFASPVLASNRIRCPRRLGHQGTKVRESATFAPAKFLPVRRPQAPLESATYEGSIHMTDMLIERPTDRFRADVRQRPVPPCARACQPSTSTTWLRIAAFRCHHRTSRILFTRTELGILRALAGGDGRGHCGPRCACCAIEPRRRQPVEGAAPARSTRTPRGVRPD